MPLFFAMQNQCER
jgi:hypothetical protein